MCLLVGDADDVCAHAEHGRFGFGQVGCRQLQVAGYRVEEKDVVAALGEVRGVGTRSAPDVPP